MIAGLRFTAFLSLVLSGFTLVRPKTGWGRLVFFIPKLFAGSFIGCIGLVGLCSTIIGLFFLEDVWLGGIGFSVAVISFRHIYRISRRSWRVGQIIAQERAPQKVVTQRALLPYQWVMVWKERSDVLCQKDVPMGSHNDIGEPILADLWQSSNPNNRSGLGLIYLHGSGWHYADKDFGTRHFFRHLAKQGHVIADLAYTLAPKTDLFGMVADIKIAIDWMKQHEENLGIRSDRVILIGGSAGGHLALLTGYTPNHPKLDPLGLVNDTSVHGVISYYGPPDLRKQYERFVELPGLTGSTRIERILMNTLEIRFGFEPLPVHSLLPEFLGGTPSEVPELYDLGSPIFHIGEHCPPTLLLQGLHDFSGVVPEVRKLYDNLRSVGCPVFLLELPDTDHGFDLYRPKWSPAAQAATYLTERFLVSLI